jgi:hypothetical protein
LTRLFGHDTAITVGASWGYATWRIPGRGRSWLWAKSAFRTATQAVPVLRGTSRRPLYVTAAGMPRTEAAGIVRHMAGAHRIPDALRRAGSCWPAGRIGPLPDAMKPGFHGVLVFRSYAAAACQAARTAVICPGSG